MRKQRRRERHDRSPGKDAKDAGVEDDAAVDPSDTLNGDVTETDASQGAASPDESRHDLDSLGRELGRSLSGAEATSEDAGETKPSERAWVETPPPPSRNATPEDILGLQARSFEQLEQSPPADAPADLSSNRALAGEASGSPPMEEFEERAAMAKEVLRATSDQHRSSRRKSRSDVGGGSAPEEAVEDIADEDVRFSEDLTISAKKRPRRKLFGG